jgi:transcriptional regulator with XRE-family HTH domain
MNTKKSSSEAAKVFAQNMANILNEMRKDRNLTEANVAEMAKCNITQSQVHKILSASASLELAQLWDIFHELGFDIIDAIQRAVVLTEKEFKPK